MPAPEGSECVFACIGTLFLLYVALAFRMSLYRLAGSPGEDKPNSPLNRFYEVQMLTAEWVPVGAILALALLYKGTLPSFYIDCLVGSFTLSRILFAAAALRYIPIFAVRVVAMSTCYLVTIAMAAALVAV